MFNVVKPKHSLGLVLSPEEFSPVALALISVAILVLMTSPTGQSAALFVCSCKDCRTCSHQPVRFSSLATLVLHILPVFAGWTYFKPHWSSVHHWSLAVRHCWNLVAGPISAGQTQPFDGEIACVSQNSCWSKYHLPAKALKIFKDCTECWVQQPLYNWVS